MDHSSMLSDDSNYKLITLSDSLKLSGYSHAVHCCIYSRSETRAAEGFVSKALISMQMRHDGSIGFSGGYANRGEDVLAGLCRELKEEINLDKKLFPTEKDYLFSQALAPRKLCLHFYGKEVSRGVFEEIELNALKSEDYGKETLGMVRVPMYTLLDGYRGLPKFLNNCFAGNAREQLLNALVHFKLMSAEEVQVALKRAQKEQNRNVEHYWM